MKMKQLILRSLFLVLITGMAVTSCKKDSSGDSTIVGTWTAGTITTDIKVGGLSLQDYLIEFVGLTDIEAISYAAIYQQVIIQYFTGTITIKSDNTYTDNLGGTTDSGTWSLNSDQTKLTITSSTTGPTTMDVVSLTSSQLHVQTTEDIPMDLNNDGTDEIMVVKLDVTFTK